MAREVTGAIRLTFTGEACTVHAQLVPDATPDVALTSRLHAVLPSSARPAAVVWWPYERFPFGLILDYERKFRQYVPGDTTRGG